MDPDISKQLADLQEQVDRLSRNAPENKLSMVVFSGNLDRALAAFIIGTGAVAMGMGMDVVMFFTFWGTPILRDKRKQAGGKDLMGFKREEMIDYPDLAYCGVAKFLEEAMGSKIQLFI